MAKRELVDKSDIKIQIETDLFCFAFRTREYQYLSVFGLV